PKPRPIAWKTWVVKFPHSVCNGRNGTPPRMLKMLEPRKVMISPASTPIWKRMYFVRLSNPDVGLLEGGCVVDAVAGHRDDLPLPLERVDQAHLVLRCHARDHADPLDRLEQLLVAHRPDLGARDGAALDAKLLGDRSRGHRMVAGDHPNLDSGTLRPLDRVLCRRTRRIDDSDEGEQRQAVEEGQPGGSSGQPRRPRNLTHPPR